MIDLRAFDVSPITGFLPEIDPPARLPDGYEPWDRLADEMPGLLIADRFRQAVSDLPELDAAPLPAGAPLERAMLLLSMFGAGFVAGGPPLDAPRLPRSLARPWDEVARRLDRPPMVAHGSVMLRNWYRFDPAGPLALGNIGCRQVWLGGQDEHWFTLVTVAIEAAGAPGLSAMLDGMAAAEQGNVDAVREALGRLSGVIESMTAILLRMYERCDPRGFFLRVRPFFGGWSPPGVQFEGVPGEPRAYTGGSAAQSTLIQALDAALDIGHPSPASRPFLTEMRRYMPAGHRAFLARIDTGRNLGAFVAGRRGAEPDLVARHNDCIGALDQFRKRHLEIAGRYISQQAKGVEGGLGTGGTDFTSFLTTARKETTARLL